MGRFKKGQSGNPGGRPKEVRAVAEAARKHTALALQTLVEVASTGENEGARVRAAEALLDRGHGKAPQTIELEGEIGVSGDVRELTRDALMAIAARGMKGKKAL